MEEQNKTVEVSEEQLEQMRENAKTKVRLATHDWKQKGGWVTCSKCSYPHALRVESNKRLIGINEQGMPMFRTQSEG